MANGLIRLKIAKTTCYNARVLVPEEEITVNAKVADKMVERGLASIIEQLEQEETNEETDELESMTVDELKEYATEAEVDLKGATKKADIILAIREAM